MAIGHCGAEGIGGEPALVPAASTIPGQRPLRVAATLRSRSRRPAPLPVPGHHRRADSLAGAWQQRDGVTGAAQQFAAGGAPALLEFATELSARNHSRASLNVIAAPARTDRIHTTP